jgi:hypothetical protein
MKQINYDAKQKPQVQASLTTTIFPSFHCSLLVATSSVGSRKKKKLMRIQALHSREILHKKWNFKWRIGQMDALCRACTIIFHKVVVVVISSPNMREPSII